MQILMHNLFEKHLKWNPVIKVQGFIFQFIEAEMLNMICNKQKVINRWGSLRCTRDDLFFFWPLFDPELWTQNYQ